MVHARLRSSVTVLFLMLLVSGSFAHRISSQASSNWKSRSLSATALTVATNTSAAFASDAVSLTLHKPQRFPYRVVIEAPPAITAKAAYVWSPQTNHVLYEKQSNESFPIASLTKIASALTAYQTIDLEETFSTPSTVGGVIGSTMGLMPNEQIAGWDLMRGMLIASGNDAAFTLASAHPQGYEGFVSQMNTIVAELGLTETHFTNPIGYDDAQNFSSASDVAMLSWQLLRNPMLADIVKTQEATVFGDGGHMVHAIQTTNALLQRDPTITGVKTGTSQTAGQNLVISQERDGHVTIVVLLGSTERFTDAQKLLDWAERGFIL